MIRYGGFLRRRIRSVRAIRFKREEIFQNEPVAYKSDVGEFEDHDYVIAMEQVRQSGAEDERENILAHFMEKAYSTEMEAYLAEAEYSYIQEADKRAFYMAIELWKKEAGPGRQGHKDFIAMASKMVPQLGLAKDYRAYLALLDCWPDSRLLGIKQSSAAQTFWLEKVGDAQLAKHLLRQMERNGCRCNNEIYAKVTDTFGIYSDPAVLARQQMLFTPRLLERNPFPIETPTDPTEIAASVLRQMNPDPDAQFHRFPVVAPGESWKRSEKTARGEFERHDSIIISQSPAQLAKMRKHDPTQAVIIEGPIKSYLNEVETSVYVLRSENQVEMDARQKRNLQFDPKWTRLVTNKEWFADFYGKDLETGMELAGTAAGKRRYFGAQGLKDFLWNYNNLQVEGTHKKDLVFPIEEEPFEKLVFDGQFKPIEDYMCGDSIAEYYKAGHLRGEEFADDVQYGKRIEPAVYCIAHIDCNQELLDSAHQTWIQGLAEHVDPVVQNYTVVLKDNWDIDNALAAEEGIHPSAGNRTYSEVDEVLDSEEIDDEIESQIIEEQIARQKKQRRSWFRRKSKEDEKE